jgi:hypothetical protein
MRARLHPQRSTSRTILSGPFPVSPVGEPRVPAAVNLFATDSSEAHPGCELHSRNGICGECVREYMSNRVRIPAQDVEKRPVSSRILLSSRSGG